MLFPCVNVPGNIPWPKGIADIQWLVDNRVQISEIFTSIYKNLWIDISNNVPYNTAWGNSMMEPGHSLPTKPKFWIFSASTLDLLSKDTGHGNYLNLLSKAVWPLGTTVSLLYHFKCIKYFAVYSKWNNSYFSSILWGLNKKGLAHGKYLLK